MQTTIPCPACGRFLNKSQTICLKCRAPYDHRALAPEQYEHPLCGQRVRIDSTDKRFAGAGVVVRVAATESGEYVYLDGDTMRGYPIAKCKPALALYCIEYYRTHPTTGEPGWDIHFAWVSAANRAGAEAKLRAADSRFDCVILCNEAAEIEPLAGVARPLRVY